MRGDVPCRDTGRVRTAGDRSPGARLVAALVLVVPALAACGAPASGPVAAPTVTVRPDAVVKAAAPSPVVPTPTPTLVPPSTPTPAATPAPAPPVPAYTGTVSALTPEVVVRMSASWRPGCPVPLEDLRYVTVTHHGFEGQVSQGELVVHADVADGIVEVFRALFAAGYPIRSMRLVDDFGADDDASMAADNTSAFNCRAITGGTAWSEHAYGRAIDVNPVENPYVIGRHVAPPAGRAFASRTPAPGVILADDVVVRAFAAAGWRWGGYWDSPVDYQHFSVSGR